MVNGFCKFLKLSNGDEIIVTTDQNCNDFKNEKYLSVIDAVEIKEVTMARGPIIVESFIMQPWIRIAKDDIIQIPTESIVVVVDVEDDVLNQYAKFIYDKHNKKLSSREGDDAMRELLDDIEDESSIDGNYEEKNPTFH